MLRKVIVAAREGRLVRAARAKVDARTGRPVRSALVRRWGHPTVDLLLREGGGEVLVNPDDFVAGFAGSEADRYRNEFAEVREELALRRGNENYAEFWNIEAGTAWSLFALVRSARPDHVLETGVANGVSSYFLLSALRLNGGGYLHSIDVSGDVGRLLTADERERWDLRILDPFSPGRSLKRIVASMPDLDLFMHDSDHSYKWMRREFTLAATRLRPGGWLASDDSDASYAFAEFCAKERLTPSYLFDRRKLFGAVRLSAERSTSTRS